jgi:hypothetical protein
MVFPLRKQLPYSTIRCLSPFLIQTIQSEKAATLSLAYLRLGNCLSLLILTEAKRYELLVPEKLLDRKGGFMNREIDTEMEDELRSEYDFSHLEGGMRGKYVERYRAGTNLVLLDPDVAQAFPTEDAVNEALRLLMQVAQRQSAKQSLEPNM